VWSRLVSPGQCLWAWLLAFVSSRVDNILTA